MIFSFNTYAGIDSVNEIVDTAVTVETGQMNVSSVVRDTADEQDNVVGRPSRPVNVVGEAPLVSLADPVVLDVDVLMIDEDDDDEEVVETIADPSSYISSLRPAPQYSSGFPGQIKLQSVRVVLTDPALIVFPQ